MPNRTIRDIPKDLYRTLRTRADQDGPSNAAEIRTFLEQTVLPPERLKLGAELHRLGREVGGFDDVNFPRHRTPVHGADLK